MKNSIIVLVACIGLIACQRSKFTTVNGPQGPKGVSGTSCTVTDTDGGALITCPDGTSALVTDGDDGKDGEDGDDGKDSPKEPCDHAVCHKGKTLYIPKSAVEAHLKHGDYAGACK